MKRSVKKAINQATFLQEVLNQKTQKGIKEVKMTKELKREIMQNLLDSGRLLIL